MTETDSQKPAFSRMLDLSYRDNPSAWHLYLHFWDQLWEDYQFAARRMNKLFWVMLVAEILALYFIAFSWTHEPTELKVPIINMHLPNGIVCLGWPVVLLVLFMACLASLMIVNSKQNIIAGYVKASVGAEMARAMDEELVSKLFFRCQPGTFLEEHNERKGYFLGKVLPNSGAVVNFSAWVLSVILMIVSAINYLWDALTNSPVNYLYIIVFSLDLAALIISLWFIKRVVTDRIDSEVIASELNRLGARYLGKGEGG